MKDFLFDIANKDGVDRYAVSAVSEKVIKVMCTRDQAFQKASYLEIEENEGISPIRQEENDKEIVFATGAVTLKVNKEDGFFFWFDKNDNLLLKEGKKEWETIPYIQYLAADENAVVRTEKTIDGERTFVDGMQTVKTRDTYKASMHFNFDEKEHIYGLGQGEEGIFDYRHKTQYLYQHNMRIPMPFFQSDKKYGILVDCGCLMTFTEDDTDCRLILDSVDTLQYYFIAGDNVDEIVKGFRTLTGKAVMLPKWAYGYIQSKEAYRTQQEILDVAQKYRDLNVPIDCVVQDWNTWEPGTWGGKYIDKSRYPDIAAMNKELHDMHVHSMISIWPTMSGNTYDYEQMKAVDGLLLDNMTYDAFSKTARDVYWKEVKDELYSGGFDSWWCDSTEPFSGPDWNGPTKRPEEERFRLVGDEHKKFLGQERANIYAVYHAKGIYEHQRVEKEGKRVLNLTRSGYPASQKYGTMLWSGDICATWDVFRKQIAEGLSMGLSGMPYWTFDVGGFFTVNEKWQNRGCAANTDPEPKWFWKGDFEDGVADLGYRELYVRWLQMGAFLPMFRSHGSDTPREIWNFGQKGEPYYDAIEKIITLRYKLMPYIYSLAAMVHFEDDTMLRSLLFDFDEDEKAKEIKDQFMCGRNLLICPVTEPFFYDRNSVPVESEQIRYCYLPKGTLWYDFENDEVFEGGQTIARKTALDEIPCFVKAGTILPMEKGLSYADEKVNTPLEIKIYPGANGAFLLYEDEGDGYGYEQGEYARYHLSWNEVTKTFAIEKEENPAYEGSVKGRTIAVIVGEERKEFVYDGTKVTLEF